MPLLLTRAKTCSAGVAPAVTGASRSRPRRGHPGHALEFLYFSRGAGRGERAPRELNIGSPQLGVSYRQEKGGPLVRFFPSGRKTAQISVDNTPGLVITLGGGEGWGARHPHRVTWRKGRMPRPTRKTEDKLSDIGEVQSWRRRGKVAWGASTEKKDVNKLRAKPECV